jgi:hypothetical protein
MKMLSRSSKSIGDLERKCTTIKKRTPRRGSGGGVSLGGSKVESSGYSSDGGLSKKKNELRAKSHRAREAGDFKRPPITKQRPAAIGGSVHSTRSTGSTSVKKKHQPRPPVKKRSLGGLDGSQHSVRSEEPGIRKKWGSMASIFKKSPSSLGLDESDHSVQSVGPNIRNKQWAPIPKKSPLSRGLLDGSKPSVRSTASSVSKTRAPKKTSDLDGSSHSTRSTASCVPVGKRRSPKKSSDLDGSSHSTRSTASGVPGGKKKVSKKSSDLDGSSHSVRSTSSTKSKSKKSKREQKKLRRGKRCTSSMGGSSFNSDGHSSISSGSSSKSGKDHPEKTLSHSAEMRQVLDDDDAFDLKLADDVPHMLPQRTKSFKPKQIMSQQSAMFHDLWQNPDKSFSAPNGGGGGAKSSVLKLKREAKETEEILCKRLAESDKREKKLVEASQTLWRDHEELALHVESVELQLEEELQKNIDLRRSLISQQKQKPDEAFDRAVNKGLRRQVDDFREENDSLKIRLHNLGVNDANSSDGESPSSDGGHVVSGDDDMSKAQLHVQRELHQAKSKLCDSKATISSQSKELKDLRETVQSLSGVQHDRSDNEQEMIDSLTKAKEKMKESIQLERNEMESKLKNKDDTIQHLMEQLGKLKVARGVTFDGEMPGGASLASRFGSVFSRPPILEKFDESYTNKKTGHRRMSDK